MPGRSIVANSQFTAGVGRGRLPEGSYAANFTDIAPPPT